MRIGYFAQHTVESLLAGHSPIDHLRELSPEGTNQAFRDFLGKWNFAGDRAFESIDSFSGGEQPPLPLALIAWPQPTALLPEPPTNPLDLAKREALAEPVDGFGRRAAAVPQNRPHRP